MAGSRKNKVGGKYCKRRLKINHIHVAKCSRMHYGEDIIFPSVLVSKMQEIVATLKRELQVCLLCTFLFLTERK